MSLLLAACHEQAPSTTRLPGTLRLSSDTAGVLVDGAARAMTCGIDTTTAIVAVGDAWAAAISMRVTQGDGTRELSAAPSFAQPGSAVVALRSLGDSLHAWLSSEGTVRVAIGDSVSGTFEATVMRDSFSMRVSGEFSAPELLQGCP